LEEYDFFDEMCLVALDISKEVRFAAVTDTNGKLIAGKQCKDGNINNSLIKTRLFQLSSAEARVSATQSKGFNYILPLQFKLSFLCKLLSEYIEKNKR
jgi:hypothetical protein